MDTKGNFLQRCAWKGEKLSTWRERAWPEIVCRKMGKERSGEMREKGKEKERKIKKWPV